MNALLEEHDLRQKKFWLRKEDIVTNSNAGSNINSESTNQTVKSNPTSNQLINASSTNSDLKSKYVILKPTGEKIYISDKDGFTLNQYHEIKNILINYQNNKNDISKDLYEAMSSYSYSNTLMKYSNDYNFEVYIKDKDHFYQAYGELNNNVSETDKLVKILCSMSNANFNVQKIKSKIVRIIIETSDIYTISFADNVRKAIIADSKTSSQSKYVLTFDNENQFYILNNPYLQELVTTLIPKFIKVENSNLCIDTAIPNEILEPSIDILLTSFTKTYCVDLYKDYTDSDDQKFISELFKSSKLIDPKEILIQPDKERYTEEAINNNVKVSTDYDLSVSKCYFHEVIKKYIDNKNYLYVLKYYKS